MKKRWFAALLMALTLIVAAPALTETAMFDGCETDKMAEMLSVTSGAQDADRIIAELAAFPNVKKLTVNPCKLSIYKMEKIRAAYPSLAYDWSCTMYGQVITSDMTKVDAGAQRVSNYDDLGKLLRCFPNIEQFDMFGTLIYRENIEALASAFPHVSFGWTMRVGDHDVRTDATAFSTLHNNTATQHSQVQFSLLKYCKNLYALDIGHNNVTDLSFLRDLPKIKILILAANQFTDISPIGDLKDLEYLEMFKNKVTDISPLANCKKLKDLNICFNKITSYEPLYGLKELERLWIYSSRYFDRAPQPEDVYALKAALPQCKIDSTSYSTLGGWRTGKHYDVIYYCFQNGVYVPWDADVPKGIDPNAS